MRYDGKAGTHPAHSAVDLGRHPARVNQRLGIESQPVAPFTDFRQGFYLTWPLTPLGVNVEVIFDAMQAFFECGDYRGADIAGMPVESEDTANSWNQIASERRRSISSGPRSAPMWLAVSRASCVIRVKSQTGALAGCRGKLANSVRRGM
jgi:hypothetical protein